MKRKALFSSIILFVLTFWQNELLSSASRASANEVWLKAQSKHFTLVGNASEKQIRRVGAELEKFREAVSRLSGIWQRRFAPPVTVFVFKDVESYEPFKPLYHGKPTDVSGYLQSSNDSAYITLTTDYRRQDPEAVIFHEYVHFLTSGSKRSLPAWLNEGLAEYFGTFVLVGDGRQIVIGQPIPAHLRKLREAGWLPMQTLLTVSNDSPVYQETDKKTVFYAQSWALVHWMMAGDADRQSRCREFLAALTDGLSAEEAFKQIFQTDIANLELELREYVRRNKFNSQTISFNRRIETDESITITELGDAELKAHLGDLLWHIEQDDTAEFALERALKIDPKQPLALSSLGLLRLKQKHYGEARQLLQQAIETGSATYLTYYSHAFAWQQQYVDSTGFVSYFDPQAVTAMRASLNRARELMPDFPDTYKTLAFINLVEHENLEESVELAKKAIALEPGREDFQYTLAQVYLKLHQFSQARQTLKTLLAKGANVDIRQRANQLLQSIDLRESEVVQERAETERRLRREQETASQPADDPTRPPGKRFDGEQVRGLLTRLDCSDKEVTLTVVSGVRTYKFRANWGKLALVRHTREIPNQITCGAMTPAPQVIVTYRPASDQPSRLQVKFDGEPVGVEFLKPTGN
ncbi:MAG: tetratricopeptide repeat protein [Acidobacteria bacterium]|nr:tetratricopeptide repeat protein [Acidobacteriota bacterium]